MLKSGSVSNDDPEFSALLLSSVFGGLGLGLFVSVYGTDPFNATANRIAAEKAARLVAL